MRVDESKKKENVLYIFSRETDDDAISSEYHR